MTQVTSSLRSLNSRSLNCHTSLTSNMSQEQPTLEEQLKTLQEQNQRLIAEASKQNCDHSPVLVSPVTADENEVVTSKELEELLRGTVSRFLIQNASARGTAPALPGTSFVPPLLLLN